MSQVTAEARTAVDDVLSVRLGPPRGLLNLARTVRLTTDQGTIDPALSKRLLDEVAAAARSASANDTGAMNAALNRFGTLITAAPAGQIGPEVAADLLASSGVLAAGPRGFEAEAAQRLGVACLRTDHPGYTGSGFVACLKTRDSGLRFNAPAAVGGDYTVRLRYATAMGATQTMTLSITSARRQPPVRKITDGDGGETIRPTLSLRETAPGGRDAAAPRGCAAVRRRRCGGRRVGRGWS